MKLLNSPITRFALSGLAVAGVYFAADASTAPLQSLPINSLRAQAIQHLSPNQDIGDLANLYPLKAKASPVASPAPTADDVIPVDDAFLPRQITQTTDAKPAVVDYFPLLQSNNVLLLQAVTGDGAIINKHFYPCGSPLAEYAYPGPKGASLTPRLICNSKKPDSVRIAEQSGKRTFELSLN